MNEAVFSRGSRAAARDEFAVVKHHWQASQVGSSTPQNLMSVAGDSLSMACAWAATASTPPPGARPYPANRAHPRRPCLAKTLPAPHRSRRSADVERSHRQGAADHKRLAPSDGTCARFERPSRLAHRQDQETSRTQRQIAPRFRSCRLTEAARPIIARTRSLAPAMPALPLR